MPRVRAKTAPAARQKTAGARGAVKRRRAAAGAKSESRGKRASPPGAASRTPRAGAPAEAGAAAREAPVHRRPAAEPLPPHLERLGGLADVPGVGERMLENFAVIGVRDPADLARIDADAMYRALGEVRGQPPTDAMRMVLRKIAHWARTGDDVELHRFATGAHPRLDGSPEGA